MRSRSPDTTGKHRGPSHPCGRRGPVLLLAVLAVGLPAMLRAQAPDHWAWHPAVRPDPPPVADATWARNPIDRFVLDRLEREGVRPAAPADPWTWIRRVSLALTGLPPSPEEAEAFAADPSTEAREKVVDRLLASPTFGERWAAVWLDQARYADSCGYGSDPLREIWRYRDWVIEAFNRNLPFDRFTIEQLSGDLLPGATVEQRLATAFHRNTMTNTEGGTDDEEFRVAAVKDRAETTAQVWMGLTLGCAECHDHRYDPVTQEEYYRFYAFFNQTEDTDQPDDRPRLETPSPEQEASRAAILEEISALEAELSAPSEELDRAQVAWEAAMAHEEVRWHVIMPEGASTGDGVFFRILDDGSLLADAPAPATATYTVTATTDLAGITGFRLEALPHDALPHRGPGRSPDNGNFVLNELRVRARPVESGPVVGRIVRIENPGKRRILSLAEVEVISGGEDRARGAAATQSSTDFGGEASRASDGVTDGHYEQGSVTHTRTEDDPWWEVDLGSAQPIERIALWNRTDGELEARLAGCRVQVLDAARQIVWQTRVLEPPRPMVVIDPATWAHPVALAHASADFGQDGWPASAAVDGDGGRRSGWAISPQQGRPHQAVFETNEPLGDGRRLRLELTLEQTYGDAHVLGRFRIAATTAEPPVRALPAAVAAALLVPAGARDTATRELLRRHYREIAPALEPLRHRLRERRAALEQVPVATTPVMRELPEERQRVSHVMVKGNFLMQGAAVEADVPAFLPPLPQDAPRNRLGLARWLVSPANPLVARVAVNRLWARLFGRGLVATEEDFGTQGTPPSHPALLDWLAVDFREGGWDTKRILRAMVLSATFGQASHPGAELLGSDPDNRLLARGPRVRLEAEMVRDQVLAASGLLDRKVGGPSVFPPQPEGLWQAAFNAQDRTWPTSKGHDRWRRGLYTFLRRTAPYPSLVTFDATSREVCAPRRLPTQTPLQALVLLNDPAFVEAAQALARRMVGEGGTTDAARLSRGFHLCLCRPPEHEELRPLLDLLRSARAHYATRQDDARKLATDPLGPLPEGEGASELAAWTVVANVLLNLDGMLVRG